MWPSPEIPTWALDAGCPRPKPDESFQDYVERLGLSFDDLTRDLDPRVPDLLLMRLDAALRRGAPNCYDRWWGL